MIVNKQPLVIAFLLGALFVGVFTYFFLSAVKEDMTFPLYAGVEGCVQAKLDSIHWIDKRDVSFVTFTNNPMSVTPVNGYVAFSLKHQSRTRLEPVINAVFHDCYPENISTWKLTEPQDQSMQNAISVLQSKLKGRSQRASIEINMTENEFKYSIWP